MRILLAVVLLVSILNAGPEGTTVDDLGAVLRASRTYVPKFQQELAKSISDEEYVQERSLAQSKQRRMIHGEVGSVWLRDEARWLWIRNVLGVDGKAVPDSSRRLEHVLADTSSDAARQLRALRDEGARFNVGGVYRNFNDPTFALNFLDAAVQSRFKFKVDGRAMVNGANTVKIGFQEQQSPTLVQNGHSDAAASGSIWVNPIDGVVMRTHVTFLVRDAAPTQSGPVNQDNPDAPATIETRAEIDVRFEPVAALDGLVAPMEMREQYEQTIATVKQRRSFGERVTCVAKYSHFRRFRTSAKIVPGL